MPRSRLSLVPLIVLFVVLSGVWGPNLQRSRVAALLKPSTDLLPIRSVARIPGGTVLGERVPDGWTHVLLIVEPRLGVGDVAALPAAAARYARQFQLTILARTHKQITTSDVLYRLDRVAVGYAVDVGDGKVVLARGDAQTGNLDFIARQVFEKNDEMLEALTDVGRTDTALVFDAPAIVLRDGEHRRMIYRHLIGVDPRSGTTILLVWLLEPAPNGDHTPVDDAVLVPPGLREDRVLSVKREKLSFLGLPGSDALALVGLPKEGRRIPFTPFLREAAGRRRYSPATMVQLETAVRIALE